MDCKTKLLRCQNYGEARKILETMKATPSQRKLTEIAFANPGSREVLLTSVIQEQEGANGEEKKANGENEELYYHENDSAEHHNLARDPAYASVLDRIRERFEQVRQTARAVPSMAGARTIEPGLRD